MLEPKATDATETATSDRASDALSPGKSTLTGGILQRKGAGNGGGGGGSNQEIAASGFSGSSMPVPYKAEMEQSFGRSFDSVQAYGGGAAAQAASALGSEAYAVGQQVAFASTSPSKDMVAHELAHTVQQGDAGPVQSWTEGSEGDAYEHEANDAAASVLAGQPATVNLKTGPAIHKWGGSDHYTIGNLAGQKAVQAAASVGITDLATANIDPNAGGVAHGNNAPSQSGVADPTQRGRNAAGGIGTNSTGITTDHNQTTTLGVVTGSGGTISFGAASRVSGDYATTVNGSGGLASRSTEVSGAGSAQHGGGQGPNLLQFAQMTIGGMTNSNHFFPVNQFEYRGHHTNAKAHATTAYAAKMAGDQTAFQNAMHKALEEEGFANHFLQDTFSSGHMAPRSLDSCEDMHNDRHTTATALNNAANGATQTVSSAASTAGSGVGTVTGAVGGFFHRVANLQNPFSAEGRAEIRAHIQQQADATSQTFGGAAQSLMQTVTSPIRTGGVANQAVEAAERAHAFYNNAIQGLERSKQWHDYFCALPNGLPTTLGRFHGDYMMDGHDLEFVSDTAASSIAEVISIAHGVTVPHSAVQIPAPDFGAIMADPMAGPVWKLMMQDYRASLAQARAQLQPGDTMHTDGGTTNIDSNQVMQMIEQSTFGGTGGNLPTPAEERSAAVARAGHDPSGALHDAYTQTRGIIQDLQHYCSTEFGYNANLGGGGTHGLDDNLNAPVQPGQQNTDAVGDGAVGRAFDVCQLEGQFGLVTGLIEKATSYKAVLSTAHTNPQFTPSQVEAIQTNIDLCDAMIAAATAWKARIDAFIAAAVVIPAHTGNDVGTVGSTAFGLAAPSMLQGAEGNRVAWGAGHPEWISNAHARNAFRDGEVVPAVRNWFNQTGAEPNFRLAAAAPAAAAGGH